MPVKFQNNAAQILAKLNGAIRDSLEETGAEAVEEIRENAPKKTGALSESYDYEIEGDKLTIGSPLPYALPVEMGTHDTAAQPHLRPAAENAADNLGNKIKRKMR